MEEAYDKNERPSQLTDVSIGLYLNRISAVYENNEEISIDVFLQVIREDKRSRHKNDTNTTIPSYVELKIEERHEIWVLLVTTLLTLVTMFNTVRNNSRDALELKCIEVWLISCILFVFLALVEYFIVLFGIRYDKHWRTAKTISKAMASSVSETQMSNSVQRKNGLEQSAKAFASFNKVTPENKIKNTNIPSNAPPIVN